MKQMFSDCTYNAFPHSHGDPDFGQAVCVNDVDNASLHDLPKWFFILTLHLVEPVLSFHLVKAIILSARNSS